jgi:transcriptional regulator with XRE-family HTH domain
MEVITETIPVETLGKTEQKSQFVELRAKGYTYRQIAQDTGLSIGTLTAWNKELSNQIGQVKRLYLEELYQKYYMVTEARISQLGGTLEKINKEIVIDLDQNKTDINLNTKGIATAFEEVLRKLRSGEITKEQADRESRILANMLKAYESEALEKKIDQLRSIIDR